MKRFIPSLIVLAMVLSLMACGTPEGDTDSTGSNTKESTVSQNETVESQGDTLDEPDKEAKEPVTEYTNADGITFQIVTVEQLWEMAVEACSSAETNDMYFQMDMMVSASETFKDFGSEASLSFMKYILPDMEDGTARRLFMIGKLYDDTYTTLFDQCSSYNGGEWVTIRGKLNGGHLLNYRERDEYPLTYEVLFTILEIENKEFLPVADGDVWFDSVEPEELWNLCEVNSNYSEGSPGYASWPCYVELEAVVGSAFQDNGATARLGLNSLELDPLSDGTPRRINLSGTIYKHTDEMLRASVVVLNRLYAATVDDETYATLVKTCSELKSGDTVIIKACMAASFFDQYSEETLFYNTTLAIIDIEKK